MKSQSPRATSGRAFTLVELLVVIAIIVLLVALLVPVLSGVRKRAKATATMQMLNGIATASTQFELSERRLPGYFTPAEMGDQENLQRGFSGTENLIADLAGGVLQTGAAGGDVVRVGPKGNRTVLIDIGLIGATTEVKGVVNKGYWVPDAKNFIAQTPDVKQKSNVPDHLTLPDVVDYFGNPLLVWTQDESVGAGSAFAAKTYDPAAQARFYWAPNAAFLRAGSLGRGEEDQQFQAASGVGSLLNDSGRSDAQLVETMTGVLGNSAYPIENSSPAAPSKAKGRMMIQSSGIDGIYLGGRERGGRVAGATNYVIRYTPNVDPLEGFDDIFTTAGN